jgi:hypothetical protein
MIVRPRFFPFFKPLTLAVALATASSSVHGAGTSEADAVQNLWSFNLKLYM